MKVLLFGGSGQVGNALSDSCPADVDLVRPGHRELDVGDPVAVETLVRSVAPALIINAAAYTAVDRAESEADAALRANSAGPGHLARAAVLVKHCRLIHVSTDYVFDGESAEDYRPEDLPNPLSIYGRSKLDGERAVLMALPEAAVVLRTAWVYAPKGRNFLLTMLRLLTERGQVRVVSDQYGTPTAAVSVARAIWRVAELPQLAGVLHWTDAGVASWYDFACEIALQGAALGLLRTTPVVQPISTSEYPTPARRPARSVLDTAATARALALKAIPWRDNVVATLRELCGRSA